MSSLELTFVIATVVLLGPVSLVALMNMMFWSGRTKPGVTEPTSVSILIPARNEELDLKACVEAALAQGSSVAEILIYNDRSIDSTQQVLDDLIKRHNGILKQVPTQDLRNGWVGKTNACDRLAEQATSAWMLFLDADTRLKPGAVESLVAEATKRNASLVSAWPNIEMSSFAERLLMPLLNFVVFTLFPAPISRLRNGASLGLAHGACILANRDTYRKIGGHSLVKDQLFEDTSLARAWRAHGENSQVIDGRFAVSVRMYSNLSGIWEGFLKNYYPAFRSPLSFSLFQAYLIASYLVLPALMIATVVSGTVNPLYLGLSAASLFPRAVTALMFRHPLWSVLLHPVGVSVMLLIGFRSLWLYSFGTGVGWKGRRYKASGMVVTDD